MNGILVVGLGNPGKEYEATRHNLGFMGVDAIVEALEKDNNASVLSGKKDPFYLCRINAGPSALPCFFTKPLTYMNRSGLAVQHIANYYRIAPEHILVLHDELDLPLGKMKFKIGGGNAGHNGLKSIQEMLGTGEFYRMRLGIGKSAHQASSHVLSRFSQEEFKVVDAMLPAIVEVTKLFIAGDTPKAQLACNSFKLPEEKAPAESKN